MTHRSLGACLLALGVVLASCAPERVGSDATPTPMPTPAPTSEPTLEPTQTVAPVDDYVDY